MDEFQQQELSIQMLEAHRQILADDARELARTWPDMQVVGLILAADSPEAARFLESVGKANDPAMKGKIVVCLVPRDTALRVLAANNPQTLDWIEPKSTGDVRRLPLVAATKDGHRLGYVEYRM